MSVDSAEWKCPLCRDAVPRKETPKIQELEDERCLICNFGGELVLCDFEGCRRVYHERCLGLYPFDNDENSRWFDGTVMR